MAEKPPVTRRYLKELRLRPLRALITVGKCKSFAAASKDLGLATPSGWQQIKTLEDVFHIALLRVQEKRMNLTDADRALSEMAVALIHDFDRLHEWFETRMAELPRRLVLASTTQWLRHELRRPNADFRRRFPTVELSIIDGPSAQGRRSGCRSGGGQRSRGVRANSLRSFGDFSHCGDCQNKPSAVGRFQDQSAADCESPIGATPNVHGWSVNERYGGRSPVFRVPQQRSHERDCALQERPRDVRPRSLVDRRQLPSRRC